jgi:ubiquinone biosynthesis protein UbiJ
LNANHEFVGAAEPSRFAPSRLLAGGLETVLNTCLRLAPDSLPRAAALAGKALAVELVFTTAGAAGPRLIFYLLPTAEGIRVADGYPDRPDVWIRGTPLALANQFRKGSGEGLEAGVDVHGDTHLANAFQALLGGIAIDWEEQLSQRVGDALAHQLGNVVRELQSWGRQALATLFQNTAEYLQQETRALPPRGAMAAFLDAVDTLRSDTDRLEARLRRLQQALTV